MKTQTLRSNLAPVSGGGPERGSVLVLALLVMIIMTLLGLAFVFAGEMESKMAVNKRDAEQALYVAEAGVRLVKSWFDAPGGSASIPAPTIAQMDRSLRYVDDNADGTYGPYSSAQPPFNTLYRQGTSDPFEKPYRGSPSASFLGTEDHPDLRISEGGSTGERAYLASLNARLFPSFPSGVQRARIFRIDVYSPPIFASGGQRVRYGIATVKVTAGIYEHTGTPAEARVATRMAKAVLNELPMPGPLGALQSNVHIDFGGSFTAHWGLVSSTHDMDLPNLLNRVPSSVPWHNRSRIIARDMDLDGSLLAGQGSASPDDVNNDGTLDFDTWIASSNVEDPWLRVWAEGDIPAISPGCSEPDCQPSPWFQSGVFGGGTDDHSNIFKNVSEETFPTFDYALWKSVAQSGGSNLYYYASEGRGTETYRLNGTGPSTTFRQATEGKRGLFFFDTATNTAPYDANHDGSYDNLADLVQISGRGYQSGGFIYLNAPFKSTGGGNSPEMTIAAPGEPYIDANGNRQYDPDEYFVDLTYPNAVGNAYVKHAIRRAADGFTRQIPWKDASADGKYTIGINFNGVFYTNGIFDAQGNWAYYGAVITKEGMTGGAGTPDIYFDERLVNGAWPPPELQLPRTVITAWETEN